MSQIEHELQMELHWKRNEVRDGAGNPAHLEIEGTVDSMRTSYRRMEEDQRRLGLRQRLALSDGRQVDTFTDVKSSTASARADNAIHKIVRTRIERNTARSKQHEA
jgi:hypothetical protein